MLDQLRVQFGEREFVAATIVERLPNNPNLKRIFSNGAWDPTSAQVSAQLRKHVGQVVGMGEVRGQWVLRGERNRHTKVMGFKVVMVEPPQEDRF
jgi:hypothetical protein